MATTRELIEILKIQHDGWNTDGEQGLLPQLNAAHKILMSFPYEQNIVFSEANGRLPYLVTTDGTYNYTLDDTYWRCEMVLVKVDAIGLFRSILDVSTWIDYGYRRSRRNRVEYLNFGGRDYFRVPFLRTWPSTETAAARVSFTENPGSHTEVYELVCINQPTELVSDTIQGDIPPPWDEMYLLPAASKLIEGLENGNYMEARQEILGIIQPALAKEMNGGEQGFDPMVDERGF